MGHTLQVHSERLLPFVTLPACRGSAGTAVELQDIDPWGWLARDDLYLGIRLAQAVQKAGGRVLQIHVEERMHVGCGDAESTASVKPALEKLQQPDDVVALQQDLIAEAEVVRSANGHE